MNKQLFIKSVTVIQYLSLVIATIAVLVTQFIEYIPLVIIGMGFYALGFLMASIRSIINCDEVIKGSKQVNGEKEALVTNSKVEVLNSKKAKASAIFNVILWVALLAFSVVVIVLYPKAI